MQKVERKQHTDRRRGRLTAVLLCALLLIAFVTAGILLTRRAEEMWIGEDHISRCWMNVKELADRGVAVLEGGEADE